MSKICNIHIYRSLAIMMVGIGTLTELSKKAIGKDNLDVALSADRKCQEGIRADRDNRSTLQLGIDRWWGTIERDRSFPVTWTVNVDRQDDYQLNIVIEHINNWQLVANSTALLNYRHNFKFKQTPLRNYNIDLGCLKTGTHVLKINAFKTPSRTIVEKVKFELSSRKSKKQLTTFFIADRPDPSREIYRLVGSDRPLTRSALIDRFAPVLYFSTRDSIRHPHNAEGIYQRQPRLDIKEHRESASLGDSDTYLADVGKPPYPSEVRAYAAILEKTISNHQKQQNWQEIAINYYFFYPISDWKKHGGRNIHEGDWEGITVFLKQKGDRFYPDRAAFAQHIFAPQVVPWQQLELVRNSHRPKVFVGLGGHASYPQAGTTSVVGILEEHHGQAPPVFLTGKVRYLPRVDRLNARHWLLYPGRWGHPDFNRQPNPLDNWDGDSAPRGPLFLDTKYSYKDSSGRGLRWLDPWQWSHSGNKN